jgi:hydrogenase maturation protein HypF
MGRLFDAVSSILNIGHENRYEGECAANLEREAVLALRKEAIENHQGGSGDFLFYFAICKKGEIITVDPKPVLEEICRLRNTTDAGLLALYFHFAVAEMIVRVCESIRADKKINTVALCGGVFQNTILTEEALKQLREKGFRVYVNEAVPPNDGSISLGQTYIGLRK